MAYKALYDLAPAKLTTAFLSLLTCMARYPMVNLLDKVTCIRIFKGGWGKYEFHWEVGLGLGFKSHKMVPRGSIPLRTWRQPGSNNCLHLTSQSSVPGTVLRTLHALTHLIP